jgi:peptide deformylase
MVARAIEQIRGASKILREVAVSVDDANLEAALKVATDLSDTMLAQSLSVGLAANQIGSSLSVAVIRLPDTVKPLVLINPVVISTSGKKDRKRESCMSVWGQTGEVERRDKISITFLNSQLESQAAQYSGFTARIIQHEIDHLNGVLYIDHVGPGRMQQTDLFNGFTPDPSGQNSLATE